MNMLAAKAWKNEDPVLVLYQKKGHKGFFPVSCEFPIKLAGEATTKSLKNAFRVSGISGVF